MNTGLIDFDMWQTDAQEKTLAWARYLFWADLLRRKLDEFLEGSHLSDKWQDRWHYFAYMSFFYGAEFVVIEGWREAGLHDRVIDDSLVSWSDVVNLLRRYRNGVFHYQPKIIESKFMLFLKEAEQSVLFVRSLHDEFLRYFWSYVNDCPGNEAQRSEFKNDILQILGWIPDDVIEAKANDLLKIAAQAEEITAGDLSESAKKLREVAKQCRNTAEQQVCRFRQYTRSFLWRKESRQ